MRKFEEIFHWSEPDDMRQREILIELDGWYLYEWEGSFFYAHGCKDSHGGELWGLRRFSCNACKEVMSEGVQAVGKIYYWGKGK